jgi:hypothetical protein
MEHSMMMDQDLWSAKLPNGEFRSGTLEQLREAFQAGHLGAETWVRASGSHEWTSLADALKPPPPAPAAVAADGGLWQARLADGQVRSGTREQLEEAFRAGHLDTHVMVLASGTSDWVKLETLWGREEHPSTVAPEAPVAAEAPAEPETPATEAAAPQTEPSAAEAVAEEPAPPEPADAEAPLGDQPLAKDAEETPRRPAASETAELRWQVQLTDKQLDQAFQAGLLGEDALVRVVGSDRWARLGDIRRTRSGYPAENGPPEEALAS